MAIWDTLTQEVLIERTYQNIYYVGITLFSLAALIVLLRSPYRKLCISLWASSGIICLLWEFVLWITGIREYNGFGFGNFELLLHALTEAGPGLIFMVLFAHRMKMIDISHLRDKTSDLTSGKLEASKEKAKLSPEDEKAGGV